MAVKAIVTASVPFDVALDLDETSTRFCVPKSWLVQKGLEMFLGDRVALKQQIDEREPTDAAQDA